MLMKKEAHAEKGGMKRDKNPASAEIGMGLAMNLPKASAIGMAG
ncbi:hypothetical protein [Devosia chinhatensis]|nr:hypothetical protein [Devosia chinhatensis]